MWLHSIKLLSIIILVYVYVSVMYAYNYLMVQTSKEQQASMYIASNYFNETTWKHSLWNNLFIHVCSTYYELIYTLNSNYCTTIHIRSVSYITKFDVAITVYLTIHSYLRMHTIANS